MNRPFGRYFFLAAILVFLLGCEGGIEQSAKDSARQFFDASDYFKSEIDRLSAKNDTVLKVLQVNGKRDSIIGLVDYQKELDAFLRSDINKVSWQDKYEVDSVFSDVGWLESETYMAKDTSLRTREFKVEYDTIGVFQVEILNISSNPIIESSQSLLYRPSGMYFISNTQKTIGSMASSVMVEGRILK